MTGKTDSFTESGDLARTSSGVRAQNWTLPAGITVSRTFAAGTKTALTSGITVAVAQDLSRINPKDTVGSDLGSWTARGVHKGRTVLRVNAGISATFGSRWSARIGYSLEPLLPKGGSLCERNFVQIQSRAEIKNRFPPTRKAAGNKTDGIYSPL